MIGCLQLTPLQSESEVPLYRQLFEQIAAQIHSGKLARGERLAPTRELAGQLGLNRTTVSAAYEMLESQGLISGQVGRGSYVTGHATGPDATRDARVNWGELLERGDQGLNPQAGPVGRDAISFVM